MRSVCASQLVFPDDLAWNHWNTRLGMPTPPGQEELTFAEDEAL